MSDAKISAGCLCGEVRWELDLPLRPPGEASAGGLESLLLMSHCHCSRCRKAHGSPFATFVTSRAERFRLLQGRESMASHESSPGTFRSFCGRCGSVVPDGAAWQGWVGLPAGPFDGDLGVRPACHLFAASRAPWDEIHDDLPRFDAYPPGFPGTALADRPFPETARSKPPGDEAEGGDGTRTQEGPRGSCLCGQVTYRIPGPVIRSRTCHCSRCRKACSAAHVSYLVTGLDGVEYLSGEPLLVRYKVPEARYFQQVFCRACGSSLPRKDMDRQITVVPMGTLDDDPGVRPGSRIFVGSRAPWDIITDALPRFDEAPPG